MSSDSIIEPSWQKFNAPQSNFKSKLKGVGSSSLRTYRSVIRNKRRSISMIAGLILGVSILSGILIYSNVLMDNIYDTIIEGAPYEIRMDFVGNINSEQIDSLVSDFLEDPKVTDARLIYGNGPTVTESTGSGVNQYTKSYLRSNIFIEQTGKTLKTEVRIINSSSFFGGEIGESFNSLVTGGELSERGIWVDSKFAEDSKLKIGSNLGIINLSISVTDPEDIFEVTAESIVGRISIENSTIAGIIDLDSGASAGLFSDAINEMQSRIILPSTLIASDNSFYQKLTENEMHYCVVKIDESKFNLADLGAANSQINKLKNTLVKLDPNHLIGTNEVETLLLPFQIMNIFIITFDFILTAPVVILSIYLLSFGIDLSLEERKYQVGVLKTQGASPKQVKRKILAETLLLAMFGLIIGYILSLIGAWIIGTATGYMTFNWDYAFSKLGDFLIFDRTTFFMVGGMIFLILYFMSNGKSNKFIDMEISETVRRVDDVKKEGWLRSTRLDIVLFAIGLLSLGIDIGNRFFDMGIDLGIIQILLSIMGPFAFWIGGASFISILALWVPSKLDSLIKRVSFLKDVNILVKSKVFRQSGEIPRLALIIALTVSFAVLASVQGTTGEVDQERQIEWAIGSDIQVKTGLSLSYMAISELKSSVDGIEEVMALVSGQGRLMENFVDVYSIDSETFDLVGNWQVDNFPKSDRIAELNGLSEQKDVGCLAGKQLMKQYNFEIGNTMEFEFLTFRMHNVTVNNTMIPTFDLDFVKRNISIIGTFDHLPGGIGGDSVVVDHMLTSSLYNLTEFSNILPTMGIVEFGGVPIDFANPLILSALDAGILGVITDTYLVKVESGISETAVKDEIVSDISSLNSIKTLKEEISEANKLQSMDYGIPGLLTMDFIVSLLSSTLATFIFMSILMERRKKEFAIMRSFGASKKQVYKIVFSETIILLLTAVIWGLLIGIGLSYLFNGFFEFMMIFIKPASSLASGSIPRLLIFDWFSLFLTLLLSFGSMMFAVLISVRGAIKSNISTVVRQL